MPISELPGICGYPSVALHSAWLDSGHCGRGALQLHHKPASIESRARSQPRAPRRVVRRPAHDAAADGDVNDALLGIPSWEADPAAGRDARAGEANERGLQGLARGRVGHRGGRAERVAAVLRVEARGDAELVCDGKRRDRSASALSTGGKGDSEDRPTSIPSKG